MANAAALDVGANDKMGSKQLRDGVGATPKLSVYTRTNRKYAKPRKKPVLVKWRKKNVKGYAY